MARPRREPANQPRQDDREIPPAELRHAGSRADGGRSRSVYQAVDNPAQAGAGAGYGITRLYLPGKRKRRGALSGQVMQTSPAGGASFEGGLPGTHAALTEISRLYSPIFSSFR